MKDQAVPYLPVSDEVLAYAWKSNWLFDDMRDAEERLQQTLTQGDVPGSGSRLAGIQEEYDSKRIMYESAAHDVGRLLSPQVQPQFVSLGAEQPTPGRRAALFLRTFGFSEAVGRRRP